ncbi:hypothetical protein HAX54_016438, partial [Datura stramonium]|nr:hypothetical protein [Datura stramonium]
RRIELSKNKGKQNGTPPRPKLQAIGTIGHEVAAKLALQGLGDAAAHPTLYLAHSSHCPEDYK